MFLDTLLVHIPFHYRAERVAYIKRLIENFKNYRLKRVDVVVDTNSELTRAAIAPILPLVNRSKNLNLNVTITCHDHLEHPFDLTWVHRQAMSKQLQNYDLFMYLEDDILVPWETFISVRNDQVLLEKTEWIRGVLRIEKSDRGVNYLADFKEPMGPPEILHLQGGRFFQPKYPYSACWIYTRAQMTRFFASEYWPEANYDNCAPAWSQGKRYKYKREKAAFGMAYLPQNRDQDIRQDHHRIVLPIPRDGFELDSHFFVYHLPRNYIGDRTVFFAKIPTHLIFLPLAIWEWHPIYLKVKLNMLLERLLRKLKTLLQRRVGN
jgi:hypothetical protein